MAGPVLDHRYVIMTKAVMVPAITEEYYERKTSTRLLHELLIDT